MHFLHPEFLYYMLPVIFILFGLLLTQKPSQETYFSKEVMAKLRVSANTLTLQARNGLFFLMAVLMVVALAGPVIDEGKVEIKAKSADIMIALDISDSMLAEDVYPNRLKLAKQKALELLHLAPTERVGVIGFAKNSYLVSPLSFDSAAVAFLLRALDTNSITEKGTNFLSMLDVVDNSIKNESKKYLLILSDGGDKEDFSQEIEFAKEKNIVVFILGMGTTKGAPIKKPDGSFIKADGEIMISKLNENIKELATQTGGVYIQSLNSNADIKAMLSEIESHSEKKELKSQEIARFIPLFYYPLGLALLILLIATSSMSKRERMNVPSLFILALVFFHTPSLNAGLLDFMELEKAKVAYESGEYKESESLYKEYKKSTKNAEANYNIANSLYKQGKYKEAISSYEKATFDDKDKRAKNFSNLGNAYVKAGEKEGLKKALKAYESSLEIEENAETRENLEAVKKAIKEQEKQKQKQENKDNKDKSDKNEKSDKDEKSDKSDKSDKKDEENKKQSDKDKKSEDEKKKEQEEKDKKEQEAKDKKSKEKTKNEAEELEDNNTTAQPKPSQTQPMQMSDEEEKKWLKQLSKKQTTYLYKLSPNKKFEENSDEKPW